MSKKNPSWKGKFKSVSLKGPITTPTRKSNTTSNRSPGIYISKGDEDMSFEDAHGDYEGFRGNEKKPVPFPSLDEFATKSKGGRRTRKKTRKTIKKRKTRRKRRFRKRTQKTRTKKLKR